MEFYQRLRGVYGQFVSYCRDCAPSYGFNIYCIKKGGNSPSAALFIHLCDLGGIKNGTTHTSLTGKCFYIS